MADRNLPPIGVITIWYQAAHQLDRFLANLQSIQYPRLQPVFVIHGQAPDEVERLRAAAPGAVCIQPHQNLGCAAGWNLGIRYLLDAGARYVGIWNADVGLDPSCLSILLETLEGDPTIGACQPLLLYSDEPHVVEMYGGSANVRTGEISHDYHGVTDLRTLPGLRDAQYLDGGTMLMRADVLWKAGKFDELLFVYGEDVDQSLRIRAAGYRTVAVRDARAWHYHREIKGPFPPPYEVFYRVRNRSYLARKHAGLRAWLGVTGRTVWEAPWFVAHYLHRGRGALARAYLAGMACGMTLGMGKRGWVQ